MQGRQSNPWDVGSGGSVGGMGNVGPVVSGAGFPDYGRPGLPASSPYLPSPPFASPPPPVSAPAPALASPAPVPGTYLPKEKGREGLDG